MKNQGSNDSYSPHLPDLPYINQPPKMFCLVHASVTLNKHQGPSEWYPSLMVATSTPILENIGS